MRRALPRRSRLATNTRGATGAGLAPGALALSALLALLAGCAALSSAPPGLDTSPVPARHAASPLPEGWHHGAFMEIFVRAYADSDGDGIGDLRGLISRLDDLKDLGIRGIWLMPITASGDHDHGYATTDFRAIEPAYGKLADFDELIRQAHARGIGVVMDYVINHASAEHPMFVAARADPHAGGRPNPWRDWFVWADTAEPGWEIWGQYPWYHRASQPWAFKGPLKSLPRPPAEARDFYFGTFGPHMPDFNFRNPKVVEYHFDSLRFWLNRGLDGYRLDAVPHLIENSAKDWNDQPESRRITAQVRELIQAYPNRYVVCEATAKPIDYGQPALCGGAFAFGYVQHFVGAALGKADSVRELAAYYRSQLPTMATFVSSHDIFAGKRLWDQVGGDEAAYKLAAAGYLLQPGTPFIYYGEEVGQAGVNHLGGDMSLRAPMSWTPDAATGGFTTGRPFRPIAPNVATHNAQMQRQDPASIRSFYKAMLALRNAHQSIARGRFEHSFADGLVLGFQRHWKNNAQDERTLVLINYGKQAAEVAVPGLQPGAQLQRLHASSLAPGAGAEATPGRLEGPQGAWRLKLPAQSVQVWRLVPG